MNELSKITIKETSIYTESRIALSISGAPATPIQQGSGYFDPEGIIIVYGMTDPHAEWKLTYVEAHGPKLRPNGQRSTTACQYRWWPKAPKPAWICEFITKYWPEDMITHA